MKETVKVSDQNYINNQKIILAKKFDNYRSYLSKINSEQVMVHDFLEIFYVVKGSIKISTELEDKKLQAGDLYIISPNLVHRILPADDDNILLFLQCECEDYKKIENENNNNVLLNNFDEKIKDELIIILGNIYITSNDREISSEEKIDKVDIYINKILSIVSMLEKKSLDRLRKKDNDIKYLIAEIIRKLPEKIGSQSDTGLDKIANDYNISYSYLSRTFKRITGENYTDYLLKIKMNIAVDLLINTKLKISDVAYKSGFTSIKTFNNTFRKLFSISPSKFREEYRNIETIERISPLFLDINTQMFIEYIYSTNAKNKKKEMNDKHIINVRTENVCIKEGIENILHLKHILSKEFNILDVSNKLEELKPKYLLIELYYDGEELYIIKSNSKKEKVSDKEFNILVNVMSKNNITPFVRINYEEIDLSKSMRSYESYYHVLEEKITLLYTMIGYDKMNKYIFEMYVPNMKNYLIDDKNLNNLVDHIEKFRSILSENVYYSADNFGLYFGEILRYEDFEAMDKLFELVSKPNFINFNIGLEIIMGSSVNYVVNLLDDIKKYINTRYGDIPLITGINYNLPKGEKFSEDIMIYYNLFLAKLHIHLQKSGYFLLGSNIIYDNKMQNSSYLIDEFGINQSAYYAYKLLSDVKGEVVTIQPGVLAARDSNSKELSIYLYEDYDDYLDNIFRYGYENYILSSKEVRFEILGLDGLYKMTKYILSNKGSWIEDEFLDDKRVYFSINEEERNLIENRYKPYTDISFFKCSGSKEFIVDKKPNDVVLIKIRKV